MKRRSPPVTKMWTLPHDTNYAVILLRKHPSKHVEFINWCAMSGIELFWHQMSKEKSLVKKAAAIADGQKLREKGFRGKLPLRVERKDIQEIFWPPSNFMTQWYLIRNIPENVLLTRLKWVDG